MSRTLQDLRTEADKRLLDNKIIDALKVYRLVLEGVPSDFELRLKIADILEAGKASKLSTPIVQAVARYDIKSGNPLRAMVAIKLLEKAGLLSEPLMKSLINSYSSDSQSLGRGIKPAPADYSAPVRDDIDLDYPMSNQEILNGIAQLAAHTEEFKDFPGVVPPVAIFSTLDSDAFSKLYNLLTLERCKDKQVIVQQGETGDKVYFLAQGEVRIVKAVERPNGEVVEMPLARLGPGSLFGEMALVSSAPRGASVIADGNVDVLTLKKKQVEDLAGKMPGVAKAMGRFTQERLISNLMATNPLFGPFDEDSKKQLLGRFTGHDVPAGTIFLEQGKAGNGLYLILQGEAEVLTWDGAGYVKVAVLQSGDVAGEISLINEEPITATVRTTSSSTLLFLARELFYPLVEAVPELLAHFATLANERKEDTLYKISQSKLISEDFFESVEDVDKLDGLNDDDLVCI